ncbi:hypothetical protein I5M32_15890 [Pedobacter sp. SD-b]|uniref:Uncharacterized protein n=1 Tax=Pedobacter segetis TaxID=2793069 RepID=A0ABS1BNV3_9SPHI|nr:hypothetical protein [Pedobacter segetis]MBK0384447.1 hypothetical protein [Pedobacter segetis]
MPQQSDVTASLADMNGRQVYAEQWKQVSPWPQRRNINVSVKPGSYVLTLVNMGLTLQKWSGTDYAFYPEELNAEENDDTGSGTTLGGGGNVIKFKYKKIEVNKKDCPD